jgi:hypothetical protein
VKPKNTRFFGKPKQYPFDLMVRSKDAAHFIAAVRGYFTEKPALPSWMPFVLGAGAILVTLLLIIVAVLVFQPQPTPTIASFQVSSTQVAQGTPIVVNWSATNVSQFTLRLNGTPVLTDINSDTPGVSLDTQGLSGNVIISLQGINGGQQTIASQTVNVYRPVGAFIFTAEPTQLVRYVVQDLSVNWSVTGAVTTRITGLENFSSTPTDATFGPDGTLTGLVGIPTDALTLTLYAQDEGGNLSQQTLEIPVINPECVPSGASATLYGGPDTRHQVVSTVGSGAFVVVDAQDSGGTWLRVQLPGGLHGWGRTVDFTCAQNFSVADLVKEANVPTVPPPTTVPTVTLTPTRTPPPPTRTPRPNVQAVGTSTPSG